MCFSHRDAYSSDGADGDWSHRRPIANFRLFFNLGWSIFSTVQVFIKFTGKGQLIYALMTFVKLTFRLTVFLNEIVSKWLDGVCNLIFRFWRFSTISLWWNAFQLRFLWVNIYLYFKLCRMRHFKGYFKHCDLSEMLHYGNGNPIRI